MNALQDPKSIKTTLMASLDHVYSVRHINICYVHIMDYGFLISVLISYVTTIRRFNAAQQKRLPVIIISF